MTTNPTAGSGHTGHMRHDSRASSAARVVDALLETPVVPSFSRIGHEVRSRVEHWTPVDSYDMTGRVVVLTGATSGLGLAAARTLAASGATLALVGRNEAKLRDVVASLDASSGRVTGVVADMGDLDAVRRAADEIATTHAHVDALIHNAGALTADRRTSPQGIEMTVASQVVGPFLLTRSLLGPVGEGSRVLTMASGGLYATGLTVDGLEMGDDYRGAEQYARAKRAQVTLNEMWADREPAVRFHAVHPGWANTPGVAESLPTFRRVMGPLLRTPDQGADTLVWLTCDDGEPLATNGGFWLDRRRRPVHKLPTTRRTDTPARRQALWDRIEALATR